MVADNCRFKMLSYLKSGNGIQRRAHDAIAELNLFRDLAGYTPVLCGTVPIAIDVAGSDLDVIMEVHDFARYMDEIKRRYGNLEGFRMKESTVKGVPAVIANFRFRSFDFELFAQPVPVEEQDAYRHMLIEYHLLNTHPDMRQEIIGLKENGWRTEPAFARVLGLTGDPYDELLAYGVRLGIVRP